MIGRAYNTILMSMGMMMLVQRVWAAAFDDHQ
jgi:flagellar biosynthesis protein FliP